MRGLCQMECIGVWFSSKWLINIIAWSKLSQNFPRDAAALRLEQVQNHCHVLVFNSGTILTDQQNSSSFFTAGSDRGYLSNYRAGTRSKRQCNCCFFDLPAPSSAPRTNTCMRPSCMFRLRQETIFTARIEFLLARPDIYSEL